jgi:hypothetical protein
VVAEGLVELPGVVVGCGPRVDGETVFVSEEAFEEGPVWGFWRDVNYPVETDIFVQPDRPAETILNRRESAKEGERQGGVQTLLQQVS